MVLRLHQHNMGYTAKNQKHNPIRYDRRVERGLEN